MYMDYNDGQVSFPLVFVNGDEATRVGKLMESCQSEKYPWMKSMNRYHAGIMDICGLHIARAVRNCGRVLFAMEQPPEVQCQLAYVPETDFGPAPTEPPQHINCSNTHVDPDEEDDDDDENFGEDDINDDEYDEEDEDEEE